MVKAKFFDILELIYCDMCSIGAPQGGRVAFPLSLRDVKQEFPRYLRYHFREMIRDAYGLYIQQF